MQVAEATQQDRPAHPARPSRAPSKTALKRAEIQARKAARAAKKASDAERLEAARARAATLKSRMPDSYGEWGVTRTQAYVQLLEIITSKAENTTMTPERLEGYLATLDNVANWTLDYCQHLSMLHARAADIGTPA